MNRSRITHLLVLTLFLALALPSLATADPDSPTDFVQTQTEIILQTVQRETSDRDAVVQRQEDLMVAVRGFINYGELCRRALGDHWEVRTPEEQAQFVQLMTTLIETNYTVKLGDRQANETYDVSYDDEVVRRGGAIVSGTVTYDDETVLWEVWMSPTDDSWSVFDVVTDDVSLQETYGESFDEIIFEDGWDALIERIEERIAELEEDLENQRL